MKPKHVLLMCNANLIHDLVEAFKCDGRIFQYPLRFTWRSDYESLGDIWESVDAVIIAIGFSGGYVAGAGLINHGDRRFESKVACLYGGSRLDETTKARFLSVCADAKATYIIAPEVRAGKVPPAKEVVDWIFKGFFLE